MRKLALIIGLLAAGGASAQQASQEELAALNEVFACLAPGLPANWGRAHVLLTLPEPGAHSGNVRYMVAPLGAPDRLEPFSPCDPELPARVLAELRGFQPADRRGWIGLQIEFQVSGNFRLNYEYPK